MDFLEKKSRNFRGEVLKLRLPDDVKVQPSEKELERLCERIQREANPERRGDPEPLAVPGEYGGKCQLVAIEHGSLNNLEAGTRTGKYFEKVKEFVNRVEFENIPPIFIRISRADIARAIDGRNRVHAVMELGNKPYLLAYVLTEDLRKLPGVEIGFNMVKRI